MKSTITNMVINEIMSSKSNSTVILTKSDGEHIGFISGLVNNYRTTFWINALYDNDYSLAMAIANRVLEDNSEEMNKINQFTFCNLDFSKDFIIINVILDYISNLNYNCLMIIDNLESLSNDNNMRSVEILMKNCPKNLKIVLISETFPDLNYGIFIDTSPKLLCKEQINILPFDEEIIEENLSYEQFEFLYACSLNRYVEKGFANDFFDNGQELIQMLSTKYRSIVFQTGKDLYVINEKLAPFLKERGKISDYNPLFYKNKLFEYYLNSGMLVKALRISISIANYEYMDRVVKSFIYNKKHISSLYEFLKSLHRCNINKIPVEYKYARFLQIIYYTMKTREYNKAIENSNILLNELNLNSPLAIQVNSCLIRALNLSGKRKESAIIIGKYFSNFVEEYGESYFVNITEIIQKLANGFQSQDMGISIPQFRVLEKKLSDEKYINEFWYLSILQTFVGCNLDLGNYKRAIEHLKKIKEIFPYYVIPYNMISAYFFAGDIVLAKKTAEDIIEQSKWNNVTSNLADAYLLLALVKLYYNQLDEAIKFSDEGIKNKSADEYSTLNSIAIRAMLYAEAGRYEYSKDLALLYLKRCELTESPHTAIMDGAVAYCYWASGDKDRAISHARKCILGSTSRSAFWLISTSIIINFMFDGDEYNSYKILVEKFLNASHTFGMGMLSLICGNLFNPIIKFAEENGIESEYISEIKTKIDERNSIVTTSSAVKIRLMGMTSVSVDNKEIVWKTKKAKELFLLYILRGNEGIDRNEIIDIFWGDYVYVSAINNLKTTNNIIRNTLQSFGIDYKLEYSNSKYSLHIKRTETDFDIYRNLFARIEQEQDLHKKSSQLNCLIKIYGDGFATDVKIKKFVLIHEKIKEELSFYIMKVIKDFTESGEYIDAKRFISVLKKINPDVDISSFVSELDRRIIK